MVEDAISTSGGRIARQKVDCYMKDIRNENKNLFVWNK